MKRTLLIVSVAGGLLLATPGTAVAHPGHTSCGAFGAHFAEEAQTFWPFGQLVSQVTPVNAIIAEEHSAICD